VELLKQQLQLADAICLVYSVVDRETYMRLTSFWLPFLQSHTSGTPIVLVGNKIDLRKDTKDTNDIVNRDIIPLMNQFKDIETCIECSAKEILNVAEIFFFGELLVFVQLLIH
jgi:Ras family protein T1